jgi:hypothetical protein
MARGHLSPTSTPKWVPDPVHFVGVTPLPTTVIEAMFRLGNIKEMPDWHLVGSRTLSQVPIEEGVVLLLDIKRWVSKGAAAGVVTSLTVPRERMMFRLRNIKAKCEGVRSSWQV